ncbi:MAG TPA: PEP-CTERM sorting domain-containing protein, partial [Phycisphaeraceae bacterium]
DSLFALRSDRLNPPRPDELRGQLMKAWVTSTYSDGQGDTAWLVHAGNFLTGVTRAAYLINRDPALSAVYGHRVQGWIDESREVLQAFEAIDWHSGPNPGEGYFGGLSPAIYPPEIAASPLPFNMQHAAASAYVNLYLATGNSADAQKVQEMVQFFKNRTTEYNLPDGTKLVDWDYATYMTRAEDISHGGLTIGFVMRAYAAGLGFTADDIERFANVIRRNYDGAELGYRTNVDGSNGSDPYSLSNTAQMWLPLARLYPDIREDYAEWYAAHWQTDANKLLMLQGAAYLAQSESPFAAESVATTSLGLDPSFDERFQGPNKPAQWIDRVGPTKHTTSDLTFGTNGLTVTDVTSTAIGNFWAEQQLLRPVYAPGDFTITADISWDSGNTDFSRLMLRIFAEGAHPESDSPLVEFGFADFTTKLGRIIAALNDINYDSGESSLSQTGSAELIIQRTDGLIELLWDDEVLASAMIDDTIGMIELAFGRQMISGYATTFGSLEVHRLQFYAPPAAVPEPASLLLLLGGAVMLIARQPKGLTAIRHHHQATEA